MLFTKEAKLTLQFMGAGDTGQEADPLGSGDLHGLAGTGVFQSGKGIQKESGMLRREYR